MRESNPESVERKISLLCNFQILSSKISGIGVTGMQGFVFQETTLFLNSNAYKGKRFESEEIEKGFLRLLFSLADVLLIGDVRFQN